MDTLKLTEKQEMYARAVAAGADAVEAYLRSYNVTTTNEASIRASAYRVAKNDKVVKRIEQLRQERHAKEAERILHEEGGITREWILSRLKMEAENSKNSGNVRVKALELAARADGMFDENGRDPTGEARTARDMEEKILRRLQRLLPHDDDSIPKA